MLADGNLVGFIPVSDAARARAFFESTLRLRVVEESPFALVLDVSGSMLRVTPVGDFTPQPFTIAGWDVEDVDAEVAALTERGVVFNRYDGLEQDQLGVWASPSGARVAWFSDPDGNVLSLTTFPAEQPPIGDVDDRRA